MALKKYDYESLSKMKVVELRRVLGRQNIIARSRIKGITGAGYEAELQPVPVRGLRKQQLIQQILLTNKFITGKKGSKTALRKADREAVKALRKQGYTFVNRSNVKKFKAFMDMIRASIPNVVINKYSAAAAAAAFQASEKAKIPPEKLKSLFNDYVFKANEQALTGLSKVAPIEAALNELENEAKRRTKERKNAARREKRKKK